jgi:hypothetical protein
MRIHFQHQSRNRNRTGVELQQNDVVPYGSGSTTVLNKNAIN